MDVSQAIKNRRSIRSFLDKDIEPQKLDLVLEAARLAPSASNRQEWKFIVVKDKGKKTKLTTAAFNQGFIGEAAAVIVACATEAQAVMRCGQPRYTVDLSIAMSFIMLQAQELGLGTCWIGAFDEARVKEILGVPDDVRVVALTPLGYPAEEPAAKPRKSLEDIVCFDAYSQMNM